VSKKILVDEALLLLVLEALEYAPIQYDFHGNPLNDDYEKIIIARGALRGRLAFDIV
jgi:hypothetical protein